VFKRLPDVNLSEFEEKSIFDQSDEVTNQRYIYMLGLRINFWLLWNQSQIRNVSKKKKIPKLINLRHPSIANPVGFVLRIESGILRELKLVRLYLEGSSLSEVLSVNPIWWTPTVKAKVVASIVLGLRFAHSLGLIHGRLTTSNILFDLNHFIQIVDFGPNLLNVSESESEGEEGTQFKRSSGKRLTWKTDIHGFVSILFEILVGKSAEDLPYFIRPICQSVLGSPSKTRYSFNDIFEILKQNEFRIEEGVNSVEVLAFVSWLESVEQSEK
jgi:serine/threonine protein kinase